MHVYTFSEARQQLSTLLDQATKEGQVCIKRRDGQTFILKPQINQESPLDIPGIDIKLSSEEIIDVLHEVRSRDEQ